MAIVITGGLIVTTDTGAAPVRADIAIEGNRISQIGPDLHIEGAEVITADGALIMPGLIDTHTHSWQYAIRGALARGRGFKDYVAAFSLYRPRYSPQDSYDSVYGCSLAQLDAGVTGVLDFVHGANQTPEHIDAVMEAHRATGQRALVAIGSTGPVEEQGNAEEFEAKRIERLDTLSRLASGADDALVRPGLAMLTPTPGKEERVLSEADFGRDLGVQLTFHQNRPGEIRLLHEAGRLGTDMLVVHSNTASSEEVEMLAATGTSLSCTPESEIGAGWSPHIMRRAIRRGIPVGLGIDTPSTQSVDLWQQIRVLLLLTKALDSDAARQVGRYPIDAELDEPTLDFERVLQNATRQGAYCLAGPDAGFGVVETGALADLIIVRPGDPDLAIADPASYLVQYGSPAQVDTVIVDGVIRKRDGQLVGVDMADIAARNSAVRRRILDAQGSQK